MVKSRGLTLPGVGQVKWTLTEVAGHGAFVALALSYLEKDVWNLRLFACSGIFLNILFQYYRAVPLWIPLRWNALFLAINLGMIAQSIKESSEAEEIPADMKTLYYGMFKSLNINMTKLDFLHLVKHATVMRLPKGSTLLEPGGIRKDLFLVQSGNLDVLDGEVKVASIAEGQLLGERQFKSRINLITTDESNTKTMNPQLVGTRSVVAITDCVVLAWKFDVLDVILREDPGLALVFEKLMSSDLTKKMTQRSSAAEQYRYVLIGSLLDGRVDNERRKLLQQYRLDHRVSESEHVARLKEIGWSLNEWESGCRVSRSKVDPTETKDSALTPPPPTIAGNSQSSQSVNL